MQTLKESKEKIYGEMEERIGSGKYNALGIFTALGSIETGMIGGGLTLLDYQNYSPGNALTGFVLLSSGFTVGVIAGIYGGVVLGQKLHSKAEEKREKKLNALRRLTIG
ncbi:MAG: hypothetical protein HZB68_00825 [Candidatus Aenigmarchaeota archaeon]|nr:hypothetical protein [Candidatus Aenigmarchaeota archaeon]